MLVALIESSTKKFRDRILEYFEDSPDVGFKFLINLRQQYIRSY